MWCAFNLCLLKPVVVFTIACCSRKLCRYYDKFLVSTCSRRSQNCLSIIKFRRKIIFKYECTFTSLKNKSLVFPVSLARRRTYTKYTVYSEHAGLLFWVNNLMDIYFFVVALLFYVFIPLQMRYWFSQLESLDKNRNLLAVMAYWAINIYRLRWHIGRPTRIVAGPGDTLLEIDTYCSYWEPLLSIHTLLPKRVGGKYATILLRIGLLKSSILKPRGETNEYSRHSCITADEPNLRHGTHQCS